MATPTATDPRLQCDGLKNEDFESGDLDSKDPKIDTLKAEDIKSEDEKSENLHEADLSAVPSPPIAVTSAHWRTALENLLRFPGMVSHPHKSLFRPGNPIAEIALALGVTDPAFTIIEPSWVPIAERVFEIQTCCMMHAKHIDFVIAADGWVTWDITAEWCARVLQDLQGKGFHTTCTAMVPFVLRVYLQTKSWIRYRRPRGRQAHKRIVDSLRFEHDSETYQRCSMMANGFTSLVRQFRKRKLEKVLEQQSQHEIVPENDEDI